MSKLLESQAVEESCQVQLSLKIGQYLAVDPRGRAIMIAAIEKQKFVYVM
jgi:hypothetical protein